MFHVNEFDTGRIIDIIESVDDTLQYSSIELFKQAMKSVGFIVRLIKKYPIYGNFYTCRGKINQQTIHLELYQKTNDDVVCVSMKRYFTEILVSKRVKRLDHRDNDLPSVIRYNEHNGKVTELRYLFEDQEYRKENKPVHITYTYNQADEIFSTYSKFTCHRHLDDFINFSLYEVTYINNLIVGGSVCYNNELLSLKELAIIIPDLSMNNLDDLFNLKHVITKEQLKLIDMFIIWSKDISIILLFTSVLVILKINNRKEYKKEKS